MLSRKTTNTSTPNPAKPKRSRASAPKVRTGCITCKTRHLKCDEEKPTCLRCRNDGFTCDGYLQSVVVSSSSRKKSKTVYVPWLPTPTSFIDRGSQTERRFLHHVQQNTTSHLTFTSTRLDFWNRLILAPAQTSEAVRHALVALGAAHWLFLTRIPNASPTPEAQQLEHLILQQYNMAIQDLTARMGESATTDLHLTLACCLIFFCIESMMGRYTESIQHLRAGSRLLASPNGASPSRESTPTSFSSDDAICEMAQTFSTLGIHAALFLDEPVVDDLSLYSRFNGASELLEGPFESLADARRQISAIEVDFNHSLEGAGGNVDAPQMQPIHHRVHRWMSRFDQSRKVLGESVKSQAEQHEFLSLCLSRRLWQSVIRPHTRAPSPTRFADATEDDQAFTEVLDLAEMLAMRRKDNHPVFTLSADIVPALNFICDTTDNAQIQRRAIHLLRGMQRREGLWDSVEVAEYLEDSLSARKILRHGWDDGEC